MRLYAPISAFWSTTVKRYGIMGKLFVRPSVFLSLWLYVCNNFVFASYLPLLWRIYTIPFLNVQFMETICKRHTVNSAYNGSAYKELSVIRNWFSFPDLNPSLFYVKNMDIADSVIRNYRLKGTHFPVPMPINQSKFRSLSRNPLLVRTSPLDYPIIDENRINVVTDRLKIVYCLFNEIIVVLLAWHCWMLW